MPLTDHLRAFRKVLVVAAYAIAGGSILGWFVSDFVFAYLSRPVSLLENIMFITTTPLEPMLIKIKVSVIFGVTLALPILMWNIWNFVLPALKQNERKYLYFIVPASMLLFFGGVAFCFYLVLPMGIKFLLYAGSGAVKSTPFVTKTSYISFILTFLLTFGLVFQLPIVLLILIRIGILSPKILAQKRRWAILAIVILTAVVSPTPDLFTQFLMAGPMYFLYEISIWLGYLVARNKKTALA
ncbi:twin-arginine translocase subunit TatC [Dehalobacter sp.]|uniref:twin-arginine translocase subunit TatC n=1 Tax=Dehalobacter sp. TaxID=1962289 RepID=UPI0025887A83|nr:twin-arginine translocase subunit TatC [Dehalobacter sp.]MDJ0306637.1 twin-arginine translocase subunit TatC [Dehalobacter sp.]